MQAASISPTVFSGLCPLTSAQTVCSKFLCKYSNEFPIGELGLPYPNPFDVHILYLHIFLRTLICRIKCLQVPKQHDLYIATSMDGEKVFNPLPSLTLQKRVLKLLLGHRFGIHWHQWVSIPGKKQLWGGIFIRIKAWWERVNNPFLHATVSILITAQPCLLFKMLAHNTRPKHACRRMTWSLAF